MAHKFEETGAADAQSPVQQVPTRIRFFWSLSGFAGGIIGNFAMLVNQIYINALHYNPNLVNLAKSLPMFVGFVTGPMIGHLSDNTRSRWGRRKPWMVGGLILCTFLGMFLWHVPKSDGSWNWGTFLFIALMFLLLNNIGAGCYGTGSGAMGYEMTTDYNERTQLFKWGSYMGSIAGFVGPWLMPMCMWFEGNRAQTAKGSEGVVYVSMIMAGMILLTGLPAILFCREKVTDHVGEKKVPFMQAVRMTLDNKPFWLLVISNFIMRFAMNVTGFFFFFLLIYYVGKGDQTLGTTSRAVMYNTISVASLLATSPIAAMTTRMGKRGALLLTLVMSAIAYASLGVTFTTVEGAYLKLALPWGAAGHSITFQWPCLISAALIGVFTNTMPMIKSSMLADVCDYDELKHGHRREAFYTSVFGVCENVAIAISLAMQGMLLVASGFNSDLPQQTPETMRIWLIAVVVSQPLGFIIGIVSILFYPLSRARMLEIRAQIDARKLAAVQSAPG
jgi:GPH family glycoside/pentoside/hexuronide:cation symporter